MPNTVDLEHIFKTENTTRDKFLSRLFGIFNEEMIRIWCRDDRAPYADIGRPTLYVDHQERGSTLDFCLEHRESGRVYVTEMKCEMQYQDYKFLTLHESSQLEHHDKTAFTIFLHASTSPDDVLVKVGGKPVGVHGGILIWGRVANDARDHIIQRYGFAAVLSLEDVVADLIHWNNQEYRKRIEEWATWCDSLFSGLLGVT